MTKIKAQQCHAMTGKRHAPTGSRRCLHWTTKSKFCWQHLKEKEAFRITGKPLGLVTTKPIAKDTKVAEFGGPLKLAEWAQPALRPNTKVIAPKGKAALKSIKDIAANNEVTVPFDMSMKPKTKKKKKVIIPVAIAKKRKLIKPIHADIPDLVFRTEPEPEPKPKRTPKAKVKRKQRSPADKHEIDLLRRLVALQHMFNDEKLSHELRIPVS